MSSHHDASHRNQTLAPARPCHQPQPNVLQRPAGGGDVDDATIAQQPPHLKLVPNDAQQGVVASDEARQMSRAIRDVDWAILMARAQNGDSAAYQRLLEGMTTYLRSLALRWYHDPQDIEDAIQDVFLTVHVIRHTYDPARPFGPWLVAIANRRFVDRLRRQSRQRLRETSLTTEHETFLASDANHEGSLDWIGLSRR